MWELHVQVENDRIDQDLPVSVSSAKFAVKFCGFGITFAEISFCTCLEN